MLLTAIGRQRKVIFGREYHYMWIYENHHSSAGVKTFDDFHANGARPFYWYKLNRSRFLFSVEFLNCIYNYIFYVWNTHCGLMYVHLCVLQAWGCHSLGKAQYFQPNRIQWYLRQYCVSSFVAIVWGVPFSVSAWQWPHWWSNKSS